MARKVQSLMATRFPLAVVDGPAAPGRGVFGEDVVAQRQAAELHHRAAVAVVGGAGVGGRVAKELKIADGFGEAAGVAAVEDAAGVVGGLMMTPLVWPSMVRLLFRVIWPVLRVIIWPLSAGAKLIVSPSPAVLTTARRAPGPLSPPRSSRYRLPGANAPPMPQAADGSRAWRFLWTGARSEPALERRARAMGASLQKRGEGPSPPARDLRGERRKQELRKWYRGSCLARQRRRTLSSCKNIRNDSCRGVIFSPRAESQAAVRRTAWIIRKQQPGST